MRIFLFFIIILSQFSIAHSKNPQKIYIHPEDIFEIDEGFYVNNNGRLYFADNIGQDVHGLFLEVGGRLFGSWWCTKCGKWRSTDVEFCPVCGEKRDLPPSN